MEPSVLLLLRELFPFRQEDLRLTGSCPISGIVRIYLSVIAILLKGIWKTYINIHCSLFYYRP
ncbi:hypothetical protein METHB2_220045 [Candidatus Methylobacter favarea]|uniref:Uncharacterized protein n=1 Tax=Candidatus Methylobacter favarea TaxID=2707345 RepID=A0A8S0Y647_9GAMM|nr:hypothetical protein METHB2_220045 [Candidatus Methylobacter favarea]